VTAIEAKRRKPAPRPIPAASEFFPNLTGSLSHQLDSFDGGLSDDQTPSMRRTADLGDTEESENDRRQIPPRLEEEEEEEEESLPPPRAQEKPKEEEEDFSDPPQRSQPPELKKQPIANSEPDDEDWEPPKPTQKPAPAVQAKPVQAAPAKTRRTLGTGLFTTTRVNVSDDDHFDGL
jgi:hypothetical protein